MEHIPEEWKPSIFAYAKANLCLNMKIVNEPKETLRTLKEVLLTYFKTTYIKKKY